MNASRKRTQAPRPAGQATDPPCVLTIAGSDSGGGAGIQADLKTITVLGGFGMSAITALTAQNTREVCSVWPVPAAFVVRQIEAVTSDLPVHAAKTGMLANRRIVEAVADRLKRHAIPNLVVDPVLVSKGGNPLLSRDAVDSLVRLLFPLADLVTPNLDEARALGVLAGGSLRARKQAARRLHRMGPRAVLIKGGHGTGQEVEDVLYDGHAYHVFRASRVCTLHTHGTGCTLSAAIATFLARGSTMFDAVGEAKRFVTEAIRLGLPIGKGHGPTNPYGAALLELERSRVLGALSRAATRIRELPCLARLAPEVQSNLGYALPGATTREEVAAFPGRLVRFPEGLQAVRAPTFGASRHIASIILAAMERYPWLRSAMNISFEQDTLAKARANGMVIAGFDRSKEPKEVKYTEGSSLEWGTREAISRTTQAPDLIYDHGDVGKEAMIRVLGKDPEEVLAKVQSLA